MPSSLVSKNKLIAKKLPRHIGVIMDGNGRWALQRNLPRFKGHLQGLQTAKTIVKAVSEWGIPFLSLYTFSTENWKRTTEEVNYLMFLVKKYLKKEYDFYRKNKIKIVYSGNIAELPKAVAKTIIQVCEDTAKFKGLVLNLAFNYGGRDEIIRAFKKARENLKIEESLDEKKIRKFLDQPNMPDPDLIIRTGGELRLSNFLLWQSAYAELYFSPKLWPDWNEDDLKDALLDYQKRQRRFGAVL